MTILKELAAELVAMFFAEKRLTVALLALVAATASLIDIAGIDPLAGGALLLFGSLTLLVASVCHAAISRVP